MPEWPKCRTVTTSSVDNDVEQEGISFMTTDTATLEACIALHIKLNIFLSHNPAITFLDTYPKELKTYMYTDVYSHFLHNCQNMDATKIILNR